MTQNAELGRSLPVDGAAAPGMNREVFGRLVTEQEALLYHVSRSMLGSDADCRDAMQDAVLAAWRAIGSLREPKYFRTWLVRILINQCRTALRRRRPQALPEDLSAPDGADEDALAVRRAVEALPQRLRPVVVLRYWEDFSTEEIARALGIPQGTVKSRLSRARKLLKLSLEG